MYTVVLFQSSGPDAAKSAAATDRIGYNSSEKRRHIILPGREQKRYMGKIAPKIMLKMRKRGFAGADLCAPMAVSASRRGPDT